VSHKDRRRSLINTLFKALSLDGNFYENASNTTRNYQIAQTIVILAAVSHTVGTAVILLINRVAPWLLVLALAINGLSLAAGYYFWTFTIWKIGQWLRANSPNYGELLIPIGFAYAPQVLNFLTLIPLLGRPIELVLAAWSLLAVIVAVRQGLDIKTRTAILICLLGWPVVQVAIGFIQEAWSSL
jgi:hypothetical protein